MPLPVELRDQCQLFEYDDQSPPPPLLQPPAETPQATSERRHGNAHHTRSQSTHLTVPGFLQQPRHIRARSHSGAGGGFHRQNGPGHSTRNFGRGRSRAGSFGGSASDSSFSRHNHDLELDAQDPGSGSIVPTLALDIVSSDHAMAGPSISIGIIPMPPATQMTPPSPNPSIVSRPSIYCNFIQDRHPSVPIISVSDYDVSEFRPTDCPGNATHETAAKDAEVDVEEVVDELEKKEENTGGVTCPDFGCSPNDMEMLSIPRSPADSYDPKPDRFLFSSLAGGDPLKTATDPCVSDHILSPELLTDKLPLKSKLKGLDGLVFGSWSCFDFVVGFLKADEGAVKTAFALFGPILSKGSSAPTSVLLIWDGIIPKESHPIVQSPAFFPLPDTGAHMQSPLQRPSQYFLCKSQQRSLLFLPHDACFVTFTLPSSMEVFPGPGDELQYGIPNISYDNLQRPIRLVITSWYRWQRSHFVSTEMALRKREWNWPESSPLISSSQLVSSPPQDILCSSSPGQQSGCNGPAVTNAPDPPKLYEKLVIRPYPRCKRPKHGLRTGWFHYQLHRPNRTQSTQSQKLDSSLLRYIADLLSSWQEAFQDARNIRFDRGSTFVTCQQYIQHGQSDLVDPSNPLGDSQGLEFRIQQLERENRELHREREAAYTAQREFQASRVEFENSQQTSWHYTPRRPDVEPEPPPVLEFRASGTDYTPGRPVHVSSRRRSQSRSQNDESYHRDSRPHQTIPNDSPLTDTLHANHTQLSPDMLQLKIEELERENLALKRTNQALVDLQLRNQLLELELGGLRQIHTTCDIEDDSSATLRPAPHEQEAGDRQLPPHSLHLSASTHSPQSHTSHYYRHAHVEEYRYDSDNNVGDDPIPWPGRLPGSDDSDMRVLVQNLQQEVQELRSLIQDSDSERLARGYRSSFYEAEDDTDSGLSIRVWMMRQLLKIILLKLIYVLLPGSVFLYIYGSQR
ncbi:hypothetical protein D9758_011504 [Tetrapyrgos nigripes]|uniref:Uncharacterized protein n=1 Tax=Tetrapyrgos nigripes TaxID=182062 RepID=A0A8H5CQZ2_9AGAR|nr:hypothetical protein D9758_011504 [Tetrapyrgos nigripes]